MMAQAGVTIAIPNWNHEILLPRSIASALRAVDLLRNEGVPAEVLVIDDASRDGSQTLLRQLEALYSKDGLRCLCFGVNAGSAASRNQTLNHARYRYLAFLDADNELIPENLPLFLETLQQTQAAVAYGNLLVRTPTCELRPLHATATRASRRGCSEGKLRRCLFGLGPGPAPGRRWLRCVLSLPRRLRDVAAPGHQRPPDRLRPRSPRLLLSPARPECRAIPRSKRSPSRVILRIFNQVKVREFLQMNTCHLRYHPALGYI